MPQNSEIHEEVLAAVNWGLSHGVGFKTEAHLMRQVPFSFSPSVIHREDYARLASAASLLGRLIHGVAQDRPFLRQAIAPVAKADPFFRGLLRMHRRIHAGLSPYRPLPVLIMRSDFLEDRDLGFQLVECNGIAAGMGPFGQRTHELHRYLQQRNPGQFLRWSPPHSGELVQNPALERLGQGIASAAHQVREETGQPGRPVMLMVVQEGEDNVYDQRLLETELLQQGVTTVRRSFRELYGALSTGANRRLLLSGVGGIDFVYLRAGYHYRDYVANDIRHEPCCEALAKTRIFMERHRVAINATVDQQLATSKRVQLLLGQMSPRELSRFGLSQQEAGQILPLLKASVPVSTQTLAELDHQPLDNWVLKNQGEGGGHCLFGEAMAVPLATMAPSEYPAWLLMKRLRPAPRGRPALLVRNAQEEEVAELVSELGLFSVHIDGRQAYGGSGYAGYLVRSKPAEVTEGGVHSGMGVLDSLVFQ
ncbi:glutathione synthetase [Ferrimonas futtsuensis]|uniref:glutathione synthetase n=1 Tax=Ferrimonas futtsuensis TaxID=364764 RepID=UPI000420FAC4|nr:glutathione synthetase [Ferrimonas futtsuensis]